MSVFNLFKRKSKKPKIKELQPNEIRFKVGHTVHTIDVRKDYTVVFSAFGPVYTYREGRVSPKGMLSRAFYKEGLFTVWDFEGHAMKNLIEKLDGDKVYKDFIGVV